MLAPGESQTLSFTLDDRSFAVWADGWKVPSGTYTIQVGASCADIRLEQTIEKGFGGKADYSDPTFKMMVMSGADSPLRGLKKLGKK